MKHFTIKSQLFFLFLISTCCHVFAQDTIFYKNASNIVVIVKEVSQTEVQYKKLEMPDGPMYVISKSDILKIVYKNGYTETITAPAPVVEAVTSQPFTVTYNSGNEINYEKITFRDSKRRNSSLIGLVDRHPNPAVKPALLGYCRSMRNLKAGQDATRTVAIVFGGVTIATGALTLLIYSLDAYTGESFAVLPATFGAVALLSTAAAISFNINLNKKRHAFVDLYNQ